MVGTLVGMVFGRLTVISEGPLLITTTGKKRKRFNCLCQCGTECLIRAETLRRGICRSCGCLRTEMIVERSTTHGMARSSIYKIWRDMHRRCSNPNRRAFKWYGARGIRVCDRWNYFDNFLADMGPRPAGKSIDRINVNGNYEPENCRWATMMEQARNRRPPTRKSPVGVA